MSVGFVCAQLAEAPGGAHTTTWDDHMLVRFRHVVHLGYRKAGEGSSSSEPGLGWKYCFESRLHYMGNVNVEVGTFAVPCG